MWIFLSFFSVNNLQRGCHKTNWLFNHILKIIGSLSDNISGVVAGSQYY